MGEALSRLVALVALSRDGDGDGRIFDGTARERPAPLRFEFSHVDNGPFPNAVVARVAGKVAGFLTYRKDDLEGFPPEIATVYVAPEHRRSGLATRLVKAALAVVPDLSHSAVRTDAAESWSKRTGLPRPEREETPELRDLSDNVNSALRRIRESSAVTPLKEY